MQPIFLPSPLTIRCATVAAVLSATALLLAGCDKPPAAPPAVTVAPQVFAPAPPAAPVSPPAAAVAAARTVAANVQGATAGLTVRVKAIELGEDATTLTVNASFANQRTNYTKLATADTYLQDESGAKLMLKRPDDNQDLTISNGATMDGTLVFLGSVPTTARQLTLVFNEGRAADDLMGPGLTMTLPLQPAAGT